MRGTRGGSGGSSDGYPVAAVVCSYRATEAGGFAAPVGDVVVVERGHTVTPRRWRRKPARTAGVAMRRIVRRRIVAVLVVALLTSAATVHATEEVEAWRLETVANVPLGHPDAARYDEAAGDIAFWGDFAAVGRGIFSSNPKTNGFVLFDISDPRSPRELSRFRCTSTGFDVSIWDDLVILSQDDPSATPDCGSDPVLGPAPDAFAGLQLVSIADPANPRQIASVRSATCPTGPACARGSHTHTVVPAGDEHLVVYIGAPVVSVALVPLANPADATPLGPLNVLEGGRPGNVGCHDIQVLVAERLAACSGIEEGVALWDITDPLRPVVITKFADPEVQHHHSVQFSNDGRTVVLNDESPSLLAAELAGTDACLDSTAGALRFYDIADTIASYRAGAAMPPPPIKTATLATPPELAARIAHLCYGHYANVVPIPPDSNLAVRNVLSVGWGAGGTVLVDFTDTDNPKVVASHVVADTALHGSPSFSYSSYWYDGFIWSNNGSVLEEIHTDRGLEVLKVVTGGDPYERNLALALRRAARLGRLNPQTQECLAACAPIELPPGRLVASPPIDVEPAAARAWWCTITAPALTASSPPSSTAV